MYCELLQAQITESECTKCWEDQQEEIAKEFEVRSLFCDKPRTITHEMCRTENIL